MQYQTIYLDEHFIAVCKPHKLLSVPGLSEPLNLFDAVKADHPNARTIHRLDMATSGLILFALNHPSQKAINLQFERKTVRKTYVALVKGYVNASSGDLALPLAPSLTQKTRHCVNWSQGKKAHTFFTRLAASQSCSRLLLHPVTGRSHQLRVHCQYIGHPIIGDPFYGDEHEANRLMLHAQSIEFQHPISNQPILLTSPSPF